MNAKSVSVDPLCLPWCSCCGHPVALHIEGVCGTEGGCEFSCGRDEGGLTAEQVRRQCDLVIVERFRIAVNAFAEQSILLGGPITCAHHRAIETVIQQLRDEARANA